MGTRSRDAGGGRDAEEEEQEEQTEQEEQVEQVEQVEQSSTLGLEVGCIQRHVRVRLLVE